MTTINKTRQMKVFIVAMLCLWPTMAIHTAAQTFLTSLDQLATGYYRIYSLAYNATMVMSETTTGSNNVFCDTPDNSDYMQVWYINVSAETTTTKTVTIQNAVSERWMNRSGSNFHTWPTALTLTVALTTDGFIIYKGDGLHHQESGHDVVSYSTSGYASKWQIEAATIDETALAAQKAEYNGFASLVNNKAAITTALAKYFTDASCKQLKDTYQSYNDDDLTSAMSADGIPEAARTMALKVKNNAWTEYEAGWAITEKTFRVGTYKPVSKASRWQNLIKAGYALAPNSDPTGIYANAGDILTVYVSAIPNGGSIIIRNVQRQSATGDGYTLTEGFNALKIQTAGCLFVDYEVDNTTNGAAPFTALSTYPDVDIHIEGGQVNGAFSLTRGDTNADWAKMQTYLFQHYDYLQLRSEKKIFNMNADLVKNACPTKMVELLGQWDFVVNMEHNIMGLDTEFAGYFNTPMMAVSQTGSLHMYASTYGTYYNETTLSNVMNYENLFAGGSLWGPAHEIGHINQAAINIIGQSEVSNNLFSNIAVFLNGHLTSRAEYISETFENMADGVFWIDRGIWERTHLYFQLYQFFHTRGYKSDFYPEFFRALRADPTIRTQNVFVDATDDYLKFYKKACEVSGYDLTEFFQAYGFFVIPQLQDYTVGSATKQAYKVGDYGTFYLLITQQMIDAAIDAVKAMELPKANIVFIEDRVSAPDATYTGVVAGTKKTAFSGYPIGKGDVGQYTDFASTTAASGYEVLASKNSTGSLDVSVVHSGASGAVGFKVYDASNSLVFLSNTYNFTVPKKIYDHLKGTDYKIVAAGPNGADFVMPAASNFIEWIVKDSDGNILKQLSLLTTNGQEINDYPDALKAPFVTLPALTPFTFTTTTNKEKTVVATISTPFKSSTDTQGYYYYVKVRNGYLYQDGSEPKLSTTVADNGYYRWAFYGNPYEGYRIKNLATGLWLCAGTSYATNGEHPTLSSSDPTYWKLDYFDSTAANAPRFQLSVPGTSRYLNDYGGHGNNIAYYGNASQITVSDELSIATLTVSINATSHTSSYSYQQNVTVPDDVNIFIVTGNTDETVTLQRIDTKMIPADTGVILYSDGGGEKTLSLGALVDTEVTNLYAENKLSHTAAGSYTVTAAQNIYALKAGVTAFAKVQTGVAIPQNKAYLEVSSPNPSRSLTIDYGETTGISPISILPRDDTSANGESAVYNLSGQRVGAGYKGMIIRKGTKTIKR